MFLSIVIPYHLETSDQIKPLLRSINEQVGVDFNDFEILLCNDIRERTRLEDCSFDEYENLKNIRFIKSQYPANPGMSRQAGVDNAKGDYVFFCDADDCLYSYGVLRCLKENILNTNADVYRFKFLEEIGSFETDDLWYTQKDFNWVWVFAKAYRRAFLKQNDITFHPQNRWHEDTYFNLLVRYCDPKVIDIDIDAYLWKFSRTSITRVNNHEYTFNSIDEYLQSVGLAFDKILNIYKKDPTEDILKVINTYYKTLMHPSNKTKSKYEYIEECFYKFILKYAPKLLDELPLEVQRYFANLVWSGDRDFLPELSLKSYLEYLRTKYQD